MELFNEAMENPCSPQTTLQVNLRFHLRTPCVFVYLKHLKVCELYYCVIQEWLSHSHIVFQLSPINSNMDADSERRINCFPFYTSLIKVIFQAFILVWWSSFHWWGQWSGVIVCGTLFCGQNIWGGGQNILSFCVVVVNRKFSVNWTGCPHPPLIICFNVILLSYVVSDSEWFILM